MTVNVNFNPQKGLVETKTPTGEAPAFAIDGSPTVAASSGVMILTASSLTAATLLTGSQLPTLAWSKVGNVTTFNLKVKYAATTNAAAYIPFMVPSLAGILPDAYVYDERYSAVRLNAPTGSVNVGINYGKHPSVPAPDNYLIGISGPTGISGSHVYVNVTTTFTAVSASTYYPVYTP